MIEIILAMIFSALFLYGCVGLGERLEKGKEKYIDREDILINDILIIKGEEWEVLSYNKEGVFELSGVYMHTYFADLGGEDIKFEKQKNDDNKGYKILVKGYKGTVLGNSIKDKINSFNFV